MRAPGPPAGKTSGPVSPGPAEAPPSPGARVGCTAAAGRSPWQRLPFWDGACEIRLLERVSWSLQTPDPSMLEALEPRAAGEVSESPGPLPRACVLRQQTWAPGSGGGQRTQRSVERWCRSLGPRSPLGRGAQLSPLLGPGPAPRWGVGAAEGPGRRPRTEPRALPSALPGAGSFSPVAWAAP